VFPKKLENIQKYIEKYIFKIHGRRNILSCTEMYADMVFITTHIICEIYLSLYPIVIKLKVKMIKL
jgi:hypothetical protein